MPNEKNKYLEDEQVKKNLDLFKNDRDNFMNDSEHLDNIGLSYKANKSINNSNEVIGKNNLVNEKSIIKSSNDIIEKEDDVVTNRQNYVWFPIFLSIVVIILMFYNVSVYNNSYSLFLVFLIGIWIFYGSWMFIKNKFFKNERFGTIISLVVAFGFCHLVFIVFMFIYFVIFGFSLGL